jgi:hypothetical protein
VILTRAVAELDEEIVGCVTVSFGSTALSEVSAYMNGLGFRRDPEHDWSPAEGIFLLAYVLDL